MHQKILRGQPLIFGDHNIAPIHSPTSGWIEDIIFYSSINYPEQDNLTIVIKSDKKDRWIKRKCFSCYEKYTPEKLIKIIYQSGIVGLGGGAFISSEKLLLSLGKVHTLIVNAVESEPYVTADYCLMSHYIEEILIGCKIIAWISKVKLVLIAIQEDKIELISKISLLIKKEPLFKLFIIVNKYPAGSSKIIIKALTGRDIPIGQHAVDIGYLIFNIATIYAIKRAIINGEPLTERIITINGDKSIFPGNFWIRIGTSVKHILNSQQYKNFLDIQVYLGGPLTGKRTVNLNDFILKDKNCILITHKNKIYKEDIEYSCIRCGYCSQSCPVNLLPQQIYWYSKSKNHIKTKEYHVFDCIECKVCEKVCPSRIPLVKYFKNEKKIHHMIDLENIYKNVSLSRFNIRKKRLLQEKIIIKKNIRKEQIKEAIERFKQKK